MCLTSSNWRLSVPLLVVLEGRVRSRGSWRSWGQGMRYHFTVFCLSQDPPLPGFLLYLVHQGGGSGEGDSGSLPQGCSGACTFFFRVLQSHVCGHQGVQRVENYHRSLHPEPVGGEDTVSDGDCPFGSPLSMEDGLRRPEGCLPSGANSSIGSQVPQVHSWREGLAAQGPLIWSVHGVAGVHSGHGSCVWFSPPVRRLNVEISGRRADSSFVSGGSLLGKGQNPGSLSGLRNCGESQQVFSHSDSDLNLSWDQDRVPDFPGFADSLEDRKVLLNSRRLSVLKGAVCKVLEGSAGPPLVADAPCSVRLTSNKSSPVCTQNKLGLLRRLRLDSLGLPFSGRSLVVRRGSS